MWFHFPSLLLLSWLQVSWNREGFGLIRALVCHHYLPEPSSVEQMYALPHFLALCIETALRLNTITFSQWSPMRRELKECIPELFRKAVTSCSVSC